MRSRRGPKPAVPESVKTRLQTEADRLVAEVLRPRYVHAPRTEPEFNNVIDVFTRWFRSYFYFCATYACPGPNALSPTFETRFARLEYADNERFHLAFMRYTGEWIVLFRDITAEAALNSVRDDPWFRFSSGSVD